MHTEGNHQSCISDCRKCEQSLRTSTVKLEEEIEASRLTGPPSPPPLCPPLPFLPVLNITSIATKGKIQKNFLKLYWS